MEKKEELTSVYISESHPGADTNVSYTSSETKAKQNWKEQKEEQARKRKRQNDLKKTEERITALEERDKEIDTLMTEEEVYTNSVKCQELAEEKADIARKLEELYEQWEALAD